MADIIGLEEGLLWLPSHVLQEALFDHPNTHKLQQQQPPPPPPSKPQHHHFHRHYGGGNAFCRPIASPAENLPLKWRQSRRRVDEKQREKNGEGRMQAFFLASGPATSGTGVFLPTTTASHRLLHKKPACAPVLLPSRVVQALNLNVHSLGLQVSPRPDGENGWRKKNKVEGSSSTKSVHHHVNPINSPPEMFLPSEWTY